MKKTLLIVFSLFFSSMYAQNYWKKIESNNFLEKKELEVRNNTPTKYDLFSLDNEKLINQLTNKAKGSNNLIQLPNTKGGTNSYYIEEASNFEDGLAKKFPNIKSFNASSVNDPTATGKITVGTNGIRIAIFSAKHSTLFIDPYTKDKETYIAYQKKNSNHKTDFECEVEENSKQIMKDRSSARNADDGKLRTFRIAIASTGEYSQFHINDQGLASSASDQEKKAAVLSAMNTTMSRVNGIYERDLATRMVIVNNNDELIFLDADTDGLSNNSAGALINESQTKCDDIIGSANYDIGHTFSTGGGGFAGVGVVCLTNQKGRGITGSSVPKNDSYDIDYVAHEIGHQFGATHTFNNLCGGQRSSATSVEPGSGSSIMAYAGICSPNVQSNSDDHFHAVSIDQMWARIQTTANCATITNTNNNKPIVNVGSDVSIPKSTPFKLTAEANDPDGNASLTYNWEQTDTEIATMPPRSENTGGPTFRSSPSLQSPTRYFPRLNNVIAGTTYQWEVLPSVAREMNFAVVVRDNHAGGGASTRDDVKITVTDADPFTVTAPNTATTWDTGSTQTITWNKGTTDTAPINCAMVNIKLSTDGGVTFPITIKANTPNDGSEDIVIPNNATTQARIMVEAVDNVFYNVNSTNFTINSTTPTFILANNTSTQETCNTGSNSVSYTLSFDFVNGFSETVTLSATGTPNGSNVSFSPSTINADGNVTMTISNLNGANQQEYTMVVKGESTSVTQNVNAVLNLLGTNFANISLTAPANSATDVNLKPQFSWKEDTNAASYDIKVATDNSFNNIVIDENVTTNSFTPSAPLEGLKKYYWLVKPKNTCGDGANSSIGEFTTIAPSYCASTFTESNNSEFISNVTFSTINNDSGNDHDPTPDDGYQNFTSIKTNVKQGDTYQISVKFDTGGFRDHCFVFIDWNQDYEFDKSTERYDLGTGFDDVSTLTFDIKVPDDAVLGDTRMRVIIEYTHINTPHGDGACDADHKDEWGETEDYTVTVDASASIDDLTFGSFNLYPNPSNGKINLQFEVLDTEKVSLKLYDLRGRVVESKNFTNTKSIFNKEIQFNNATSGLYLLQIENGGKQTTRKLVIK